MVLFLPDCSNAAINAQPQPAGGRFLADMVRSALKYAKPLPTCCRTPLARGVNSIVPSFTPLNRKLTRSRT